MKIQAFTALTASLALASPAIAEQDPPASFIAGVAAAQGEAVWDSHSGFTAGFSVDLGEKIQLKGRMIFDTNVGRSRVELDDGTLIVNDGTTCWVSPADAALPPGMARFHSMTWPYFLAMPFKLDDPGANVEAVGGMPWVGGREQDAWELTFGEGAGDSPDDWFFLFRDAAGRLGGASYIVTYTGPREVAEKKPSAVRFGGFTDVQGAAVPTRWTFYGWTKEDGIGDAEVGFATITDPVFLEVDPSLFTRPIGDDVRIDSAP